MRSKIQSMRTLATLLLLTLATLPVLAQQEDAEGCKDSPILSRMPNCWIDYCDKKEFDRAELVTGLGKEGEVIRKPVSGEVSATTYRCSENVSFLSIARNAENALKSAGYSIIFSDLGENSTPAVTARKSGVWVQLETASSGGETYGLTVVRAKEMEQQMAATAEEWETTINDKGYCSIYGVLFDSGKASIQVPSTPCLNEMAKLLKKHPDWKMQVEGHTDNVGGKEANAKLSQARADAVRTWLIGHGVGGDRLMAKGFGEAKPVAPNTTDEERAKNRRVDLRKL